MSWLPPENLRAWLEIVAAEAEYDFDESDWDAIVAGLPETDCDRGRWLDYPLGGGPGASAVRLARDRDAGLVTVFVVGPENVERCAEAAIDISQRYLLSPRG